MHSMQRQSTIYNIVNFLKVLQINHKEHNYLYFDTTNPITTAGIISNVIIAQRTMSFIYVFKSDFLENL